MKTVFITSFHTLISKNILNTDALGSLRKVPDLRVVILVPKDKAPFFERHYAGGNVVIEGFDVTRVSGSKRNTFFSRLLFLMIDSHYLWYKRVERRDARPTPMAWVKYGVYGALVKILSGSRSLNRVARFFYRKLTPHDLYAESFERHKPSLVFSTDVFDPFDTQLLKEAQVRGVPTLAMVRSWDNCYSKGLMGVLPDRLLVNNELIKEEAETIHDYPSERITIVGLPQFDAFVRDARPSREEFFRKIGVDPARRLVVFAPAGSLLSDTDGQICDILEKALAAGEISRPVHFFVRNHPNHPADVSKFGTHERFTIQVPGHVFNKNPKDTELDPDDQRFLADLLYHADVVMYVATSLSLDATVYDKPQIIIDFDGYEKKKYTESVERYHDEDHMKKLIATGGVHVVRDKEALIRAIDAYLADPSLDREARKRIVKEQLFRIDGKSGQRVAEKIMERL